MSPPRLRKAKAPPHCRWAPSRAMNGASDPQTSYGLQRFIYKQATLDDLEKLGLASHKPTGSPSGGGARDVRIRPWSKFEPVIRRMFPETVTTSRGKDCFACDLHWHEVGLKLRSTRVRCCPPSGARGDEGWLAESYKIPAFTNDLPQSPDPPVFFFICQDGGEITWGGWMKDADLRAGEWHPDVSRPVLNNLSQARADATVRGYVDFAYNLEGHFHG